MDSLRWDLAPILLNLPIRSRRLLFLCRKRALWRSRSDPPGSPTTAPPTPGSRRATPRPVLACVLPCRIAGLIPAGALTAGQARLHNPAGHGRAHHRGLLRHRGERRQSVSVPARHCCAEPCWRLPQLCHVHQGAAAITITKYALSYAPPFRSAIERIQLNCHNMIAN